MIAIVSLIRLVIGGILLVLAYFLGRAHGFREGERKETAAHRPTRPVFYHGSSAEIAMLTPQPSKLTPKPVVFGTPSYTDAVIFSGQWTDYDFAMWGDGKKRYLEEQYPGAFAKLNRIGYIHHLRGTDAAPFQSLGSGLSGEHICTADVTPFRVDKMNVLNYLLDKASETDRTIITEPFYLTAITPPKNPHRHELPLVMRTHAEVVAARKTAEPIALKGNIICHIVPADMNDTSIAELCAGHGIRTWRINRDNIDDADLSELCIMIGDPISGNTIYEFSCTHIYQIANFNTMVASFEHKKTTAKEYSQYLRATRDLYDTTYVAMDIKQLDTHLSARVARMKAKLQ